MRLYDDRPSITERLRKLADARLSPKDAAWAVGCSYSWAIRVYFDYLGPRRPLRKTKARRKPEEFGVNDLEALAKSLGLKTEVLESKDGKAWHALVIE